MAEGILQFSVASAVEDVLKQHGKRLSDIDLASRKAQEASLRRYEAAGWLRKTVGVVGGKDLPAEPSEEEFRLGLRSGIILCNAFNKLQPGAVPKVVEAPSDSVIIPDGAALSAYQYFENVRNFLVVVQELGLPTFEASDLEQGGKSSRIVNCILALKSYGDWKQGGGSGLWRKFFGNLKPSLSGKQFMRKTAEPFMNSFSRSLSDTDKCLDNFPSEQNDPEQDASEMAVSHSLCTLVRELLLDKKPEEIPIIVETMLSKVMEEFEHRVCSQNEQMKTTLPKSASGNMEMEDRQISNAMKMEDQQISNMIMEDHKISNMIKGDYHIDDLHDTKSRGEVSKQHILVQQQQRQIQSLKLTIHDAKEDIQLFQLKYQEEVNILGKHLHELAYAASGYRKVLEENRKLYNQVQDLKGNIRVYCRVRPLLPGQPDSLSTVDHIEDGNITIITPSKHGKEGRKSFAFNKVFGPSATQEVVFSDMQPLIRSVLDGYNVCIFAYGQTGSGKTHTMTGPSEITEESLGVNYRALRDLFLISEQRKDTMAYDVSVQMMEIYNEQVRDLLVTDGSNKKLEIRNSSQNGLNVPDANLMPVSSTSDVVFLMNLGVKNRAVGATAMNDRSSRSHSCLTVHVKGRDPTSGSVLRGCMHLVDLAGSERVDKSEAVGDRLKEAQHINKSLSALGDVIASLAQKTSHIPYRNSKLTQLLQDSLGGQAKTLMFVHISPELDAIGETLSTLKFAERVSTVELGAARANKDSGDVKELKEQIAGLKAALANKEGGETQSLHHSKSFSPEGYIMGSAAYSPLLSSLHGVGNTSGNRRQGVDDVNIELARNKSASKPKRKSLDLPDLLMTTPPCPPCSGTGLKEDENKAGSRDWDDKVIVNKKDIPSGDENQVGHWYEENRQLPGMIYHKGAFSGYETATTDDSDDLEVGTSDSSEPDFLWQLNGCKVSNTPNCSRSKLNRPSPRRQSRSPERRSLIPPPPTSRIQNGVTPLTRRGRLPDGKSKTGSGK